jgi:multidrug resistance efflux pump
VFATGFVEAARDADLVFQVNGQVEQVLVEEGGFAREDEVLAVLDTRTFDQNVLNAEAALARAQADRLALLEDPQPERVRAAQASITQAQGQLNQVQGSVTQEDINAAQANVDEARAALADLEAGADTLDIQAAQTRVDQARASMQTTRDQLSQAKTQAEISMHQAAERVRSAQVDYSAAYWDWQYVKENGTDPPVNEVSPKIPLSDHSEQGYRDRFNQAEIMLRQAEDDLRAATERYEDTLQNEVTGIQEAEARLQDAQIALDQVLEPAEADQLAAARARLSNAQAQLAKLQGQQREGQLTAAQAGVANAQAQLEQLYSDPTESQLMRADANIASAEAQLEQARLNREYAELEAPFSGEIATVNIDPGDPATTVGGQPAIRMIDLSELRVEVEVPDVDIARVRVGQTAEVVADALPNEVFMGEVSFVAPAATTDQQGIIKYEVRIDLNDDAELPLRVGMSVSVTINTNTITNNSNRRDTNDTDSTDALTDTDSTDALTDTFTTNSSDDTDDTDE